MQAITSTTLPASFGITALAKTDARAGELAKLRCFLGLSVKDAALTLKIAPRTAYRDWTFARAWLYRRLNPDGDDSGAPESDE